MKKVLTTILAIVYLTTSSGVILNMHYCMGKLVSWDLSPRQKSRCGNCGMEKKCPKGCCKDEQKIIKIEKDQKNSEPAFQFTNVYTDVITPDYATLSIGRIPSIVEDYPTAHAPPRRRGTPIFILNCNFRI